MGIDDWSTNDIADLTGKIAIIAGMSGDPRGIGYKTAKHLGKYIFFPLYAPLLTTCMYVAGAVSGGLNPRVIVE